MLNLKELEKRLDEALNKETSESLNAWLEEKRKEDGDDMLFSYMGKGKIKNLDSLDSEFEYATKEFIKVPDSQFEATEDINYIEKNSYDRAA